MSTHLLVEIADDLAAEHTTRTALFFGLLHLAGVKSVVDLSAISRATLDTFLLPLEQSAEVIRKRVHKA